ncbi:MAG: hypothetical protein LBF68_07745 [Christensenellaceae bacterium]|jgi:transposase|nr:hypothetical protein [Christensenellaceae bacterium]
MSTINSDEIKDYSKHFTLRKHENDTGFGFERDIEKINALLKGGGYFCFFTNDMNSSLDQILKYYRQKDVIKKVFAQNKVEMYGNRFRTQNDKTTDGKMFAMFILCFAVGIKITFLDICISTRYL